MSTFENCEDAPATGLPPDRLAPSSDESRDNRQAVADPFFPDVPNSLEDAGVSKLVVEDLILKDLLSRGYRSGRDLAKGICLSFPCVRGVLAELKSQMIIGQKEPIGVGDFLYYLSDQGKQKALAAREISAYVGAAPVTFDDYLKSVAAQSIRKENPGEQQLKRAFSDLLVNPLILDTIGPAVNSGRGMFLYGAPGNGKTVLAERIIKCYADTIFIPRTLLVEGVLVQIFDSQYHTIEETSAPGLLPSYDQRWVKIRRPLVIVGGELTMEQLDIQVNAEINISEAPLQLKANCGIFLIDDFGRQRVHHEALLNRWIVPLEERIDYLSLPNGRRIEVPFDELIIFSTNLDPKDLVDDAFLRRIPYKVHVKDPSEDEFRALMRFFAARFGIDYDESAFRHLVERHYRGKRPFRICQARDLMEQIVNSCKYHRTRPEMTAALLDEASRNYFSAMGNDPDQETASC